MPEETTNPQQPASPPPGAPPAATQPPGSPDAVRLYNQLNQERDALHRMRLVSSLTLLAIFVVYVFFIGQRISRFDQEKFGAMLQEKLMDLQPEVVQAVSETVNENHKQAKREVNLVVHKRMPRVKLELNRAYEKMRESLFDRLQTRLLSELTRQLDRRSTHILERFPELGNHDDRAQLLSNLRRIAQSTSSRVLADDRASIEKSLTSIERTLGRKDVRARIEEHKVDPNLRAKTVGYLMAVVARPLYEGTPQRYMGEPVVAEAVEPEPATIEAAPQQ